MNIEYTYKYDRKMIHECREKLITGEFKHEYIKELFRSLRAKIEINMRNLTDKSIVMTSMEAHAGKSTIASNLAIAFAQEKRRTLIIDGDLRCGTLHYFFATERMPGLADLLTDIDDVSETSVQHIVQQTQIPYLNIINSGRSIANSAELLSTTRFRRFKEIISTKYDIIIFDSPPLGIIIDAVVVADIFSKYILVINAGKTNILDLNRKVDEFPEMKKKILGVVLNNATLDRKLQYYKKSHYYS